ncbi:MAG: UDP-N-acetylenolpyruvoylglucosamine reductase, partial [Pseudomonadales bacterium]
MHWQENVALTARNTFGLDASTRYFGVADSIEVLRLYLRRARQEGRETLILGGGSNVVLPKRYRGVTIAIKLRGIRIDAEPSRSRVQVFARSGE